MLSRRDAQFVVSEIRFIRFYDGKVKSMHDKIRSLEKEIEHATDPKSPNGLVKYGASQRGDKGTIILPVESQINSLISKQMVLEKEASVFNERSMKAKMYLEELEKTEETEFVRAFFCSGKTHREIESEFHVSNAYDRMIRLIQSSLNRL